MNARTYHSGDLFRLEPLHGSLALCDLGGIVGWRPHHQGSTCLERLGGVMAAGFALRLWLHNEQLR
jgi:hypothetical protein